MTAPLPHHSRPQLRLVTDDTPLPAAPTAVAATAVVVADDDTTLAEGIVVDSVDESATSTVSPFVGWSVVLSLLGIVSVTVAGVSNVVPPLISASAIVAIVLCATLLITAEVVSSVRSSTDRDV